MRQAEQVEVETEKCVRRGDEGEEREGGNEQVAEMHRRRVGKVKERVGPAERVEWEIQRTEGRWRGKRERVRSQVDEFWSSPRRRRATTKKKKKIKVNHAEEKGRRPAP